MQDFLLYRSYLNSVEDCIQLKNYNIDFEKLYQFCLCQGKNFFKYHKDDYIDQRRYALPLTNTTGRNDDSSFVIVERHDQLHEMSYNKKTLFYYDNGLDSFLDNFSFDLGRSHIMKMEEGGFFHPHRDGPAANFPTEETFRILITINNCNNDQMHFVLENKVLPLTDKNVYYINTTKTHSLISYFPDCYFAIINIRISKNSIGYLRTLV